MKNEITPQHSRSGAGFSAMKAMFDGMLCWQVVLNRYMVCFYVGPTYLEQLIKNGSQM